MTDPVLAEVIEPSVLETRRARRVARSLGEALADARRTAIAGERAAIGALRSAHAAQVASKASLEGELAAAREARDALVAELRATRAERDRLVADLAAERATRETLAAELSQVRATDDYVAAIVAAAPPARPREGDLARHAREQAAAAAAASARPGVDTARLSADLDRAAAALRARIAAGRDADPSVPAIEREPEAVAPTPAVAASASESVAPTPAVAASASESVAPTPAVAAPHAASAGEPVATTPAVAAPHPAPAGEAVEAEPHDPAPSPAAETDSPAARTPAATRRGAALGGPSLRAALVSLARREPESAATLLAGLLPAQAPIVAADLDYDLTIRGAGTFAITLAAGAADVRPIAGPRGRRQAAFHLSAEPLALAELLAGDRTRVPRFGRGVRLRGRRRRLAPLTAVTRAHVGLGALARAGAALDPIATLRALPDAVPAEWTAGHRFAVEHLIAGDPPRSVVLRARDGEGLEALDAMAGGAPDATVRILPETFAALLAESPIPAGRRPAIRGDWRAVATLLEWADRARSR